MYAICTPFEITGLDRGEKPPLFMRRTPSATVTRKCNFAQNLYLYLRPICVGYAKDVPISAQFLWINRKMA